MGSFKFDLRLMIQSLNLSWSLSSVRLNVWGVAPSSWNQTHYLWIPLWSSSCQINHLQHVIVAFFPDNNHLSFFKPEGAEQSPRTELHTCSSFYWKISHSETKSDLLTDWMTQFLELTNPVSTNWALSDNHTFPSKQELASMFSS